MKLKTILAGLAFACVLPMSAQFNSGSGSSDFPSSYNRLSVGYNGLMTSVSYKGVSESAGTYSGINAQYIHGFGLSSELPMYLETGLGLNWGSGTTLDLDTDLNVLNLYVPVNFAWRFGINDNFSLVPYTGINLKVNVLANISQGDVSVSLFESDAYKRFQMGWQIGVGANINRFYLGLQYELDFLPFMDNNGEKLNTSNITVSLGYNF